VNLAILKTTILSIIFMGAVILVTGIILLFYRQQIAPYMRYLLPIPPIGVASYVFVYNMFAKYDGHRPGSVVDTIVEICWSSVISFLFFFVFTLTLVFVVDITNNFNNASAAERETVQAALREKTND
jgi:hypothetical protein